MADVSKLIKAAAKEGNKLGMDLAGAADLGGTTFFCTTCHSAEGNMEALMAAKEAMVSAMEAENASVGVLLMSAGKNLVACCVVPEAKASEIAADAWMATALKPIGGVVEEGATATYARALVEPKEGEFAIKMKDQMLAAGVQLLREKGKIPDDSDSGDEVCFGDDDLGNW